MSETGLNSKIRHAVEQIAKEGQSEDCAIGLSILYDETADRLTRFAATITRQQHDAEDAVSATLLKIASRPQLLIAADQPWHYLLRMVRNESLLILRSRGRWASIGRITERLIGKSTDVVAQDDENRHIWNILERLPGQQREVVVLKIWEQMTFAEIADVLQITPSTAASRYRYALEKLARSLEPLRDSEPVADSLTGPRGDFPLNNGRSSMDREVLR